MVVPKGPRQKRMHTKRRTGCQTCRTRRVRCDETKPACNRCTSTGRKCDGYELSAAPARSKLSTPARVPPTVSDPSAAGILLPQLNASELRYHRYFLDVVAPALSGFLDTNFWLVDIPRVCHADPAIWHAIISLAAVYEADDHVALATSENLKQRAFALQQYNTAIHLVTQAATLRSADKGRALTVSVIFAYISIIQGFYDQAFMHLRAGCALLEDINVVHQRPDPACGPPTPTHSEETLDSIPVSKESIRNILLRASLFSTAFGINDLLDVTAQSRMSEDTIFWAWWFYSAPNRAKKQGSRPLTTPENIYEASRAAESLVTGLVCATSPKTDPGAAIVDVEQHLRWVQSTYVRGYRQLRKALRMFEHNLEERDCSTPRASHQQLQDTLLPLRNYLNACRILFVADPEGSSAGDKACDFDTIFQDIVQSSERILSLGETYLEVAGRPTPFTLDSTTIDALALVAQGAPSQTLRRTACKMLQRPKLEGIWHASMAGKLAEVVLDYETEVMTDRMQQTSLDGGATEMQDGDAALLRIAKADLSLVGPRKAMVKLETLGEVMTGQGGKSITFEW